MVWFLWSSYLFGKTRRSSTFEVGKNRPFFHLLSSALYSSNTSLGTRARALTHKWSSLYHSHHCHSSQQRIAHLRDDMFQHNVLHLNIDRILKLFRATIIGDFDSISMAHYFKFNIPMDFSWSLLFILIITSFSYLLLCTSLSLNYKWNWLLLKKCDLMWMLNTIF